MVKVREVFLEKSRKKPEDDKTSSQGKLTRNSQHLHTSIVIIHYHHKKTQRRFKEISLSKIGAILFSLDCDLNCKYLQWFTTAYIQTNRHSYVCGYSSYSKSISQPFVCSAYFESMYFGSLISPFVTLHLLSPFECGFQC